MSDYKRLTKRDENNGKPFIPYKDYRTDKKINGYDDGYFDLLNRLAEIEDKIENGTLIELPCKVGDTIFVPWEYDGEYGVSFHEVTKIEIYKKVIYICFELDTDIISLKYDLYNGGKFLSYWLGERFFLTKAEAKKKLEELRSKK